MHRIVAILFLLMLVIPANSQYRYHHPEIFYYPSIYTGERGDAGEDQAESPWLRYSIDAGMFFTSLSGYNTMASYISPKVFIPAGSRFMVEVGGTFITGNMPGPGGEGRGMSNDFIAYARGIFAVNERTTVYGEVAKSLYSGNLPGSKGFESYTLGMEYYITPSLRIGASVTSVNGIDPRYRYSPWGSPYGYGYGSGYPFY
jgi:hypothetical protein